MFSRLRNLTPEEINRTGDKIHTYVLGLFSGIGIMALIDKNGLLFLLCLFIVCFFRWKHDGKWFPWQTFPES